MVRITDCVYCKFDGEILFETDKVTAALPKNPQVPGHAIVFPKTHIQILEQANDEVISALFEAANKLSIAMFEGLKAMGTNLIIMNGLAAGQKTAHLGVEVIPRTKDDGLSFNWPGRKIPDEQMGVIAEQTKGFLEDAKNESHHKESENAPSRGPSHGKDDSPHPEDRKSTRLNSSH